MNLHRSVERIGRIDALDQVAEPLAGRIQEIMGSRTALKDLLSGTWLGHPLHPPLTDVPIGLFTSATVLDLIGGRGGQRAATRLVGVGLLASVATAASGAADWSDTQGEDRRTGLVHAAANTAATLLYAGSFLARRRGRRASGTALGLLGLGAMGVGAYLGGHLGFTRGVGVNHAFGEHPPDDWTDVGASVDLADGATRRVDAGDAAVLLYRRGDDIRAIGAVCSHAGGPLPDGDVDGDACTVTCPWHGSVFRLDDGEVVHGPASVPQAAYDVRERDGRIEVRGRA